MSPPVAHYQVDSSTGAALFTVSAGHQLSSTENLTNHAEWKKRQEIKMATWHWKTSRKVRNRKRFCIIRLYRIDPFQHILNHLYVVLFTCPFKITVCFHDFFPLLFQNAILKGISKCGKMIILLAIAAGEKNTHCTFPSGMCVCV